MPVHVYLSIIYVCIYVSTYIYIKYVYTSTMYVCIYVCTLYHSNCILNLHGYTSMFLCLIFIPGCIWLYLIWSSMFISLSSSSVCTRFSFVHFTSIWNACIYNGHQRLCSRCHPNVGSGEEIVLWSCNIKRWVFRSMFESTKIKVHVRECIRNT